MTTEAKTVTIEEVKQAIKTLEAYHDQHSGNIPEEIGHGIILAYDRTFCDRDPVRGGFVFSSTALTLSVIRELLQT